MDSHSNTDAQRLADDQTTPDWPLHMLPPEGYQLLGLAGRGTFSEIWQVRERATARLYAIKQLRGEWRDDVTARHLLENESRIGAAARSPHIVRQEHSVSDADRLCLILEWLDGETLEQKLCHGEPPSMGTAVWIARQCAQGLGDLAAAGYVHGDVKPDNIFLTHTGDAKLIDLGFARPLRHDRSTAEKSLTTGTAEYMAPEVITGDRAHPKAQDIYSLGITLFRMIAGRLPFQDATTAGVLKLQRQAKPPELHHVRPEAPTKLCRLVASMLAKQPIRRPTSYTTIVRELIELELSLLPTRVRAA